MQYTKTEQGAHKKTHTYVETYIKNDRDSTTDP